MVITSSAHGNCLILRRRAEHSDCRAAHCYHITTSPRCRALNGTSSPSYHITKSLTTQPTKHTTKSPTSHLPPQTHNTHQNISPLSHNATQSTTTLLATYHHPISPKKSLITQPAKLIDIQLYQKQQHTHHTNKLPPHTNQSSPALHLPHQIHNTNTKNINYSFTNIQLNQPTRSYQHIITPKLTFQKSLTTQPTELTSPNSIKTATHTTQTNCHHTQTNHLPTHRDITHLTSTTPKLTTPTKTSSSHSHNITQSTANQHNFIHKTTSSNKHQKIHNIDQGK